MKTTINKEQIEAIISETYLNAKEFVWNDKGVELDYDRIVDDQVKVDTISAIELANDLDTQIVYLKGKLDQSEKMYTELLNKTLFFELGDDEEEEGDGL